MPRKRTVKMKLMIMPKKVIPLAEVSILDVVFVAITPLLLDFLDKRLHDCFNRDKKLPNFYDLIDQE